jgi:hypothetical protein
MAAAFNKRTTITAAFTWVNDEQRAFQDFRDLVATNSSGTVAAMIIQPARELFAARQV